MPTKLCIQLGHFRRWIKGRKDRGETLTKLRDPPPRVIPILIGQPGLRIGPVKIGDDFPRRG